MQWQGEEGGRQRPDGQPEEAGRHREGAGEAQQGDQSHDPRQRGPAHHQVSLIHCMDLRIFASFLYPTL